MLQPFPDIFGFGEVYNIVFDDDDEEYLLLEYLLSREERQPSFFRERWKEDYLRNLAQRENSFITEYRMNPSSFNILVEMLEASIAINRNMEDLSMHRTGSNPITPASRVGDRAPSSRRASG